MPRAIAVIEDEETIAAAVAARLRAEGFLVEIAADGPSGVALVEQFAPDLVVLDLMLPGFDGIEVCRRIQAARPVPVVMLTARDSETDMLVGLGVGADDYITKPFSPRELVARIQAVLRRVDRPAVQLGTEVVAVADLVVDASSRRVRRGDRQIHLTPTEFELLLRLASRPGVVHTRESLLLDIWGWRDAGGTRTVDSHVAALRRKLGAGLLRTVHGVGYAVEAHS